MSLPPELRQSLVDPDFWAMYCFESDDEYFDQDEHVARFEVGGGHALDLSVSDGYFDLGIRPADRDEAISVAWDDQAHPHPHVLRWDELDLVCRAAALTEPELRHPGPGVALLTRFLAITDPDDVDVVRAAVHGAFTGLRGPDTEGFWPDAEEHGVGPVDFRDDGVVWSRDEAGDQRVDQDEDHDGPDLYSTRTSAAESAFPWELWRSLLDHAERTLAAAVDPAWAAALPADTTPGNAAEVARALKAAGCANRIVLRALTDPVHPAETAWVLELVTGAPRGSLLPEATTDARHWWA
ncbi:hypothetical protein ABZ816_36070 [Actinosynnema sp. NPDC047251]|uniref:Uncharacterized protein n=1 Tax=Saccharothrix espanaensis (strain ATCC 51144 / DSM 44229 / JCM 9112 / NBRC 15066 / NRRL 15764) TaxID=1179773 RepID=K0JTA6_SACES|nr:hypothetical protein [Saccharothrix espanaensis]CCH29096.1 hypothetical protein BN6_17750 [Saccharothrix espanaensis DSM 44229]